MRVGESSDACTADPDAGLTDADTLAIINSRGLGGAFVSPHVWKQISDWDKLHVYLAPRDDEGDLITLRRRISRARAESGDPDNAGQEFPSMKELGVPEWAIYVGVPMCYVLGFWQQEARKGKKPEEIEAKFRDLIKKVPPSGEFAR